MATRGIAVIVATIAVGLGAREGTVAAPGAQADAPAAERIDYLTFAQGAVPLEIGGTGAALGAGFEQAVRIIDGSPLGFVVASQAPGDADTEFLYELPALTTFDRFAVPNVLETPSRNQTFTRLVEVYGSAEGPAAGFTLLASATLETHRARGQVSELSVTSTRPVRWVRLRLTGGIRVEAERTGLEFSEIIGNGTQETPAFVDRFTGAWRTMAPRMRLVQDGPLVSGCYDRGGELTGTVTGNILRATGIDRDDNVPSAFILSVAPDGSIRGVRSDNRGPFRYFSLAVASADAVAACGEPAPPALGCGAIVHGITFDFDSDVIRADSDGVLARLHEGLRDAPSTQIVIEGHTSSEGSDAYNLGLSERRAQAVVADLVRRGRPSARLTAAGLGESRPIASNNDESGRALNRRVEVRCL